MIKQFRRGQVPKGHTWNPTLGIFENTTCSWCVILLWHTHALLTLGQSCICSHSMMLLGITSYKYLYHIKCELTDEEVLTFELDQPNVIRITPTHFIDDCSHNCDSPFNKATAIIFADNLLNKVNNHSWYSEAKLLLQYHQTHIITMLSHHISHISRCAIDKPWLHQGKIQCRHMRLIITDYRNPLIDLGRHE